MNIPIYIYNSFRKNQKHINIHIYIYMEISLDDIDIIYSNFALGSERAYKFLKKIKQNVPSMNHLGKHH